MLIAAFISNNQVMPSYKLIAVTPMGSGTPLSQYEILRTRYPVDNPQRHCQGWYTSPKIWNEHNDWTPIAHEVAIAALKKHCEPFIDWPTGPEYEYWDTIHGIAWKQEDARLSPSVVVPPPPSSSPRHLDLDPDEDFYAEFAPPVAPLTLADWRPEMGRLFKATAKDYHLWEIPRQAWGERQQSRLSLPSLHRITDLLVERVPRVVAATPKEISRRDDILRSIFT